MVKFNYKKWLIENKYGNLNEQNNITCYACSGSGYGYNDFIQSPDQGSDPGTTTVVSMEFTSTYNNNPTDLCGTQFNNNAVEGTYVNPGLGDDGYGPGPVVAVDTLYFYTSVEALEAASGSCGNTTETEDVCNDSQYTNMSQYEQDVLCNACANNAAYLATTQYDVYCECCPEIETTDSNYQPFCCDINAINFGQTANGQPYGTNPGEPEQYLMINGPQGDMCDNSICQGNVNEPESIGDPPFDDNITGSGLPGGLPEPPDKGNILTKLKSRPRRTPKTVPTKQPSRRVRGRKTRTKLTEIKDIIEIMIDELSGCYEEGIDEGKKKKKKKKKDRCHRKADSVYGTKTSAYKSGAIVKCRKGMIWKKGGKKKKKKK